MEWFTNQTNWIVSIHSFSSEEIGGESGDWGDPKLKKFFANAPLAYSFPLSVPFLQFLSALSIHPYPYIPIKINQKIYFLK